MKITQKHPWTILLFVFLAGLCVDGIIYLWLGALYSCGAVSWLILIFTFAFLFGGLWLYFRRKEEKKLSMLLHMSVEEYREYIKKAKKNGKERF